MVDTYLITFDTTKQVEINARSMEGFDLKKCNILLKSMPAE